MTRTPLMLLPAMGCDGQLWARQIMDLGDVAEPAFGDLFQDETISSMASRVLADAPPRFAVAGVSLGGYVALEVLRQAPERVVRIAMFGTRASMEARTRSVADQGLIATAPHADPQLSRIVSGPALAMAERVGPVVFARQQRALLARPYIAEAIAAIRVPTLVAVGDRDKICSSAEARGLAQQIPAARFYLLKSCGHLSPMERPGEVTNLLREWLASS